MQIARASQSRIQSLPTRASVDQSAYSTVDRVDTNSYRERLTDFGLACGPLVGMGVGMFASAQVVGQGLIQTGDPVGDLLLNTAAVCVTTVGSMVAGAAVMGAQGYVFGSMADRISRALGE